MRSCSVLCGRGPGSRDLPLVISQVYGGGGNSGATYTNDFVELFNRSSVPVSLAGLSIQYGSAAGNYANPTSSGAPGTGLTVLPAVTVAPGRYFLVRLAGGAAGAPITGDVDGLSNMSATSGKVALARSTTSLGCGIMPCPPGSIVDRVGYGSPSDYEGSGPVGSLNATRSAQRRGTGCADTDDNANDFQIAQPVARDSMTPAVNCAALPTDAGVPGDAGGAGDGGRGDASGSDAAPATDAAARDAVAADAAAPDAAAPLDGSVEADAAAPLDAASTPDAAAPPADGGTPGRADSGAMSDTGVLVRVPDSGCDCSASDAPGSAPLLALGLLVGWALQRRRARSA